MEILAAAQCSLKAAKCELEDCGRDVEAVASRKDHSRRSHCVHTTKFVEKLQKKDAARFRRGNAGFGEKNGCRSGDYEENSEQESLLLLIKRGARSNIQSQGPRKPPYKSQETPQRDQRQSRTRNALVFLRKEELLSRQVVQRAEQHVASRLKSLGSYKSSCFICDGLWLCFQGRPRHPTSHFRRKTQTQFRWLDCVVSNVVKQCVGKVAAGKLRVWQQDSALRHTSGKNPEVAL